MFSPFYHIIHLHQPLTPVVRTSFEYVYNIIQTYKSQSSHINNKTYTYRRLTLHLF